MFSIGANILESLYLEKQHFFMLVPVSFLFCTTHSRKVLILFGLMLIISSISL